MEEEVAKGGAAEEEAAEEVVEEEVVEEVVAEEQAVFDGEESDAGSVEYIRSRAPEEEQRVAAEEEQRVVAEEEQRAVAEEEQRAVAEEEQRAAAEEEQRAAAQRAAEDADTEEEEELSATVATNGSEANAYDPVTDFPLGNERTALAGLHTSLAIRGVMTEFDTPSPRGPLRPLAHQGQGSSAEPREQASRSAPLPPPWRRELGAPTGVLPRGPMGATELLVGDDVRCIAFSTSGGGIQHQVDLASSASSFTSSSSLL